LALPQNENQEIEYTIYRLVDSDVDKIDFDEIIKSYYLKIDFRLISPDHSKMGHKLVRKVDYFKLNNFHAIMLYVLLLG
jgi:hypothetical protein